MKKWMQQLTLSLAVGAFAAPSFGAQPEQNLAETLDFTLQANDGDAPVQKSATAAEALKELADGNHVLDSAPRDTVILTREPASRKHRRKARATRHTRSHKARSHAKAAHKKKAKKAKKVAQSRRRHKRKKVQHTAAHRRFTQMRGWLVDN